MQLWFWAAVTGMVLAGISNFGFKIAAKQGYDADTFTFYGGLTSLVIAGIGLLCFQPQDWSLSILALVVFVSGFISSQTNLFKVIALRYIDATIFFPLFKITSPLLAVCLGIIVFGEKFTLLQWCGIVIGHTIPLLLINTKESKRQNSLLKGILYMFIVAVTSALAAALNKYAMDGGLDIWSGLWYMSVGLTIGCLVLLVTKIRTLPHRHIMTHTNGSLIKASVFRSTLICFSVLCVLFAYGNGGDLGIVQTIQGFYIVVPIVLSVLIYKEHINWMKFSAVVLCIVSLLMMG